MSHDVELIPPGDGSVRVVACPKPFSMERVERRFGAGTTLIDMLEGVQPDPALARWAHVFIDGHEVHKEFWHLVRPKPGTLVNIRVAPGDGGGKKNPLRFILQLVVLAAAIAIPTIGFVAALGAPAAGLIGAGVGLAGSLLVNALIPPPRPRLADLSGGQQTSPALSGSGARNQMRPWGVVPRVLGKMRIVPPYAAQPYHEVVKGVIYERGLLDLGPGPLEIADIKFGETPIELMKDIEWELRQGFADDPPPTLYTRDVSEELFSIELTQAGGFVTDTTAPDTDIISLDVTCQGLTRINDDGSRSARTVKIDAQFAPAGSGQWQSLVEPVALGSRNTGVLARPQGRVWGKEHALKHVTRTYRVAIDPQTGALAVTSGGSGVAIKQATTPAGHVKIAKVDVSSDTAVAYALTDERPQSYIDAGFFAPTLSGGNSVQVAGGTINPAEFVITDNSTSLVRRSRSWHVARGQYDVRVRRLTADTTDERVQDKSFWTALRSFTRRAPVAEPGHALIAYRARLDGRNLDELNCVVQSILMDWDGNDWVERATSSPAACDLEILAGASSEEPADVTEIDWVAYEAWADENTAEAREFNAIMDFEQTEWDARQLVCAAGRARPIPRDNLYSIVRDAPQSVHVQHVTPRNSWNFRWRKAFPDPAHAFRIPFVDRTIGWRPNERIVFADGFDESNATRFAPLDMFGVTDPAQVHVDGRYHYKVTVLRPEEYELDMDPEHLVAEPGDLMSVTHDVLAVGLGAGRIKSLAKDASGAVTAITLDEEVPMDDGQSYGLIVRLDRDNVKLAVPIVTVPGRQKTVTPTTAIPAASAPAEGDLVGFGVLGLETLDAIVKAIEPHAGGQDATLTLVPHAPEVHEPGPTPPFDPLITPLPTTPPAPVVELIDSGDAGLITKKDGTVESGILAVLRAGAGAVTTASFQGRFRPSEADDADGGGEWSWAPDSPVNAGGIKLGPVDDGRQYDLELRALSPAGVPSDWVAVAAHTVIGKTAKPPKVGSFTVTRQPDGTRLYAWTYPDMPADVRAGGGFQIRWAFGSVSDWNAMTVLPPGFLVGFSHESNELAAGTYSFAIKALDSSGNESEEAVLLDSVFLDDPRLKGVLLNAVEHQDGWPGTKTDCFVDSGNVLRAISVGRATGDLPAGPARFGLTGRNVMINPSGTIVAVGKGTLEMRGRRVQPDRWGALAGEWQDLPPTWDAVLPQASPIRYVTGVLDLGADLSGTPVVSVAGAGAITLSMRSGREADGGVTGELGPVGSFAGKRYLQVAAEAAGAAPALTLLQILVDGEPIETDIEDLDTSGPDTDVFERLAAGHFRLSGAPFGITTIVRATITAVQNAGSGWTWELISKNAASEMVAAPAAEFKLYQNGSLADAVIDANLKGVK